MQYGASADLGDADPALLLRSGQRVGSAIDVGDGYMVVGDDENNILRLYDETKSGPPVGTFDFTGDLPYGTTSVDIEASARSGDILYWTGSMTNYSDGADEPSRSTLFAARITGTGADTAADLRRQLLRPEGRPGRLGRERRQRSGRQLLRVWPPRLRSATAPTMRTRSTSKGMEFAPDGTTAYLAFRAPLEPTSDRYLALVIPLTNLDQLVTGGAGSAAFGRRI